MKSHKAALFFVAWILFFAIPNNATVETRFEKNTPITVRNGIVVPNGVPTYSLQVTCRAGETLAVEGTSSSSINDYLTVYIDCKPPRILLNRIVERWVHARTSVVRVVARQTITTAESKNTTTLLDEQANYLISRNQDQQNTTSIPMSHRRSSGIPRQTDKRSSGTGSYYYPTGPPAGSSTTSRLSEGAFGGILAGVTAAAAVASAFPGIGTSIGTAMLGAGVSATVGVAINDKSGVSSASVAGIFPSTSDPGYLACNIVLQGGIGTNGLAGCLYQEFKVINGMEAQIQLTNQRITSLALIVQNVQSQVKAVILTVTQLTQSLQSALKVMAQQGYTAALNAAAGQVNAQNIAESSTTQNQNNANLQQMIQQTQQSTQVANNAIQQAIQSLADQGSSEISLIARRLLQQMSAQVNAMQQTIQDELDAQVLQSNSVAAQIQSSINSILHTLQIITENYQLLNEQFTDAFRVLADVVSVISTVNTLTLDTYRALDLFINVKGELPLIKNWGTPPPNLHIPTKWAGRRLTLEMPRICNSVSGECRTCQSAFAPGNPWQTTVLDQMEQDIIFTASIPTTIDLNFILKGDDGLLQSQDSNGVWRNLTYIGCSSSCTASSSQPSLGLCFAPTNNPSSAVIMKMQSYAFYQASHTTSCSFQIYTLTTLGCTTTNLNSTQTLVACTLFNNSTQTSLVCNNTFAGTNCANSADQTGTNCTLISKSCSGSLGGNVCTSTPTPISNPPTNLFHDDQVYFTAKSPLDVYEVAANLQTPSTSNTIQLLEPVTPGIITTPFVFTVVLANQTAVNVLQPIDNVTPFYLQTATGASLMTNGQGCFASSVMTSYTPTNFRFVPIDPTGPVFVDNGIPAVLSPSRRRQRDYMMLIEDEISQEKEEVSPVPLAPVPSKKRSTGDACNALGIFTLIQDSTTINQNDVQTCTNVPGCILARIPRKDSITITEMNSGRSTTLLYGDYYTKVITINTLKAYAINDVPLIKTYDSVGIYTRIRMQVSTGLRLTFTVTDSNNGQTSKMVFATGTEDVMTVFDNMFLYSPTPSRCGTCYSDIVIVVSVDWEDNFPAWDYYDVCIDNVQPTGVPLSSTACSFLSSSLTNITIPSIQNRWYQLYDYGSPTPPSGSGPTTFTYGSVIYYTGNTAGSYPKITPYTDDATTVYATAYNTGNVGTSDLSVVRRVNINPQVCYAACKDIIDRATCIMVDYFDCVWNYDLTLQANVCEDLDQTSKSGAQQVGVTAPGSVNYYQDFTAGGFVTFPVSGYYPDQLSYTYCPNGQPRYVYANDPGLFFGFDPSCPYSAYVGIPAQQFISFPLLVYDNTNCSGIIPSNPPVSYVFSSKSYPGACKYFVYTLPTVGQTPYATNDCDAGHLRGYLSNLYGVSSLPDSDQALCLSTTQLTYTSQFGYRDIESVGASNGVTGAFTTKPYLGTPPVCVWSLTKGICENFDKTYSNTVADVIFCQSRLIQGDSLGACVNSPADNIKIGGVSVQPRCAYILPSGSPNGICTTFYHDNLVQTLPGGATLGPYDLPVSISDSTLIVNKCLVPGTQCYFEAYGGASDSVSATLQWYANLPSQFTASSECSTYNQDSIGCPVKTIKNGTAQCEWLSGNICTPLCSSFHNDPIGCASRTPLDTCYYTKSTGVCADSNVAFLNLPVCQNYNCFSASTICYAYSNDPVSCESNNNCVWMNILNGTSYCELISHQQDPECFDQNNGNAPLHYCNVTVDMGLSTLLSSIVSVCTINTTMSKTDFIATCVNTMINSTTYCTYYAFGDNYQQCFAPNDPRIAKYTNQFSSVLAPSTITYGQWFVSKYPSARTYQTNFRNLKVRSNAGYTLQNMKNAGILLHPDAASTLYACSNSSFTNVGWFCCLTSEIDPNSGQCGPTRYQNKNHPTSFYQRAILEYCQAEATLPGDTVTLQKLSFLVDYMGQVEPLPSDPLYTLNEMSCPTFLNDTDILNFQGNYSIYGYINGQVALDLLVPTLVGSHSCTINMNISNQIIIESRFGIDTLTSYANAQQVLIYDNTAVNVTFFTDITGQIENAPSVDFTLTNITHDLFTDMATLFHGDSIFVINDYTARYGGADPQLWGARVPEGVFTDKILESLDSNVYSMLATEGYIGFVKPQVFPVYRVQSYLTQVDATVTVYDKTTGVNRTYTPLTSVVVYDNDHLLPQQKDAFVFANDDRYVYSPPYSRGQPCSDVDWFMATTTGPQDFRLNYTSLSAACPFYHPKQLVWSLSGYTCMRDPSVPLNQTDYKGITYSANPATSTNLRKIIGFDILCQYDFVDEDGNSLCEFWTNVLAQYGDTYLLTFGRGVQSFWHSTGCTEQFNNFIIPSSMQFAQVTQMINGTVRLVNVTIAMDFLRPVFLEYQAIIDSGHVSNTTALQEAAAMFIPDLYDTFSSPYCGNCGPSFGTTCNPELYVAVVASDTSCQDGIQLAATQFGIEEISSTLLQFTANPGTATMILTFELQDVTSITSIFAEGQCPNIPVGSISPFQCSQTSGFQLCYFKVTNPLTDGTMQIVFGTNSSEPTCNQQQVLYVAPLASDGTQFNLCENTVTTLYINLLDGTPCYRLDGIVTNTTLLSAIGAGINASVTTIIQNNQDQLSADLIQAKTDLSVQIDTTNTKVDTLVLNITNYQATLNTRADSFQQIQDSITGGLQRFNVTFDDVVASVNGTASVVLQLQTNLTQQLQISRDTQTALNDTANNLKTVQSTVDTILPQLQTNEQNLQIVGSVFYATYSNVTNQFNVLTSQLLNTGKGLGLTSNKVNTLIPLYVLFGVNMALTIVNSSLIGVLMYERHKKRQFKFDKANQQPTQQGQRRNSIGAIPTQQQQQQTSPPPQQFYQQQPQQKPRNLAPTQLGNQQQPQPPRYNDVVNDPFLMDSK